MQLFPSFGWFVSDLKCSNPWLVVILNSVRYNLLLQSNFISQFITTDLFTVVNKTHVYSDVHSNMFGVRILDVFILSHMLVARMINMLSQNKFN